MGFYETTKRKIDYLSNKNDINSMNLEKLDTQEPRIRKLYYNKRKTKYIIYDKVPLGSDLLYSQYITVELGNFPVKLLPFITVISYGQTLSAYREKITKDTFFAHVKYSFSITEKEVKGKIITNITMLLFFTPNFLSNTKPYYYPANFSLYLVYTNLRHYDA
jgi:hypothetical protein